MKDIILSLVFIWEGDVIISLIEIIVQWGIPCILTALCTFIAKEAKSNRSSNIAIKNATVSMLRSQITSKVETYLKMGYLPNYARYCLEELYKQYSALGGNHGVDLLIDKAYNLPPNKKEE